MSVESTFSIHRTFRSSFFRVKRRLGTMRTEGSKVQTQSTIPLLFIILIGVACVLSACQSEISLWVIPGSNASNLVFGISKARNTEEKLKVESIRVFSCDLLLKEPRGTYYPNPQYAVWYATSPYDTPKFETNRLYYGKDNQTLRTVGKGKTLTSPGCYVVLAYAEDNRGYTASAGMGFRVQPDGSVIEMSRSEYRQLFTQ